MLDYSLPDKELAELRATHWSTRDKREADRIKAVMLLATGWTAEAVVVKSYRSMPIIRLYFESFKALPGRMVANYTKLTVLSLIKAIIRPARHLVLAKFQPK